MHGHGRIRGVDHDLAEIIRVASAGEESIFDQSLFILEGVMLLRVADVV